MYILLHYIDSGLVRGSLPYYPGTQLGSYVTSASLPYLVSKGIQHTNNYHLSFAVSLLLQYGCDGSYSVIKQLHQRVEDDAAAVLEFSLCYVIKMISGVAGGFD